MYNPSSAQKTLDFGLPFSGKLLADNRWVKLANEIPWAKIEEKYAKNFTKEGPPAKPLRVALGALIIQTKCNYTDEETVEQIRENPYLQYFIGFTEYTVEKPFDSSLMVHFRKRITAEMLCDINDMMFTSKKESPSDDSDDHDKSSGSSSSGDNKSCNKEEKKHGKLILDATCAPADIRYPTDVSLLNEAREKLEDIIDTLHQPLKGIEKKPRTDRKKARKEYLSIAKLRKWTAKKVRKAVGKQLTYVKRNPKSVDYLLTKVDYNLLSTKQKHDLEVIRKLYSQQQYMYQNKEHRVDNRIVSINQPHVRPIVRSGASKKLKLSLVLRLL